jgi:hypothetical protein
MKIGRTDDVMTSDWIPIRGKAKKVDWKATFGVDKYERVIELCTDFNHDLIRQSKVVILVGGPVTQTFIERLRRDEQDGSISIEEITLKLEMTVFDEAPRIYAVKSKATGTIKQLVFVAYHSAHFSWGATAQAGIYNDMVWNAAAGIALVDVQDPRLFSHMAVKRDDMRDLGCLMRQHAANRTGAFSLQSLAKRSASVKQHAENGTGAFSHEAKAKRSAGMKQHAENKAKRSAGMKQHAANGTGPFSLESLEAKAKGHTAIMKQHAANGTGPFSREAKAKAQQA